MKFARLSKTKGRLEQGLTAIELMIFIAVAGLIFLVSVPGTSMLMQYKRVEQASENLVVALKVAKSEAALRNSTVRVCPSSNGRSCRRDGAWSLGWLVFTDGNADGEVQEFELIEVFEAPHHRVEIIASGNVLHGAAFTVTGLAAEQGRAGGNFLVCYPESRVAARNISIDEDGWISFRGKADVPCERA